MSFEYQKYSTLDGTTAHSLSRDKVGIKNKIAYLYILFMGNSTRVEIKKLFWFKINNLKFTKT